MSRDPTPGKPDPLLSPETQISLEDPAADPEVQEVIARVRELAPFGKSASLAIGDQFVQLREAKGLKQAERMVGKRFYELADAIPLDLLKKWELEDDTAGEGAQA